MSCVFATAKEIVVDVLYVAGKPRMTLATTLLATFHSFSSSQYVFSTPAEGANIVVEVAAVVEVVVVVVVDVMVGTGF